MREVDARVRDGDDDVRVAGRGVPGLGSVDVLVVRPTGLAGVVQAPELAERRIVRCDGDRSRRGSARRTSTRGSLESTLVTSRLLVVLHLDENGVDLAEALLRGRAGVLQDRVLLVPRDALREADDQLALDRVRRLLRRGRERACADAEDDGSSQDDERKRARACARAASSANLRPFSTPERLGEPGERASQSRPPR